MESNKRNSTNTLQEVSELAPHFAAAFDFVIRCNPDFKFIFSDAGILLYNLNEYHWHLFDAIKKDELFDVTFVKLKDFNSNMKGIGIYLSFLF